MHFLWEPFAYAFMQRALIASVVVGVVCSLLGCYVVLRSLAFLGDALAHAVLPGVAVAYLVGGDILIGALVAGVVVALLVSLVTRGGKLKEDTAIGVFFAAALSLGVLLISARGNYAVDLAHILFGNVLGVDKRDLFLSLGLGVLVVICVCLLYKPFLVLTFDPLLARLLRLKVELLRAALFVILAIAIVVGLRLVGIGLVAAMLVTPAAAAYLVTKRMRTMMIWAVAFGLIAALTGLYLSYYLGIPPGAASVLVATGIFVIALFTSRWRARIP